MIIIPQIAGNAPVTCVPAATAVLGPTSATTFTFAGVSLGVPYPGRLTVIGIASLSYAVASVTVGGVPATQLVSDGTPAGSAPRAELWSVSVPDLATATIVVTLTTAVIQRVSVTTWGLYDLIRTDPIAVAVSTASPGILTLASRTRGAVVAIAVNNQTSATFTWSDGEDYQTTTTVTRSAAHARPSSATQTLTVAYSTASTPKAVAASFR